MAYLVTEERSGLTFGMPPLPDGMPFKSRSGAITGAVARVTDIVALRVRPALYAGHGSYGSGSGSGYRYQAQPLHIVASRLRTFFLPVFHSSARPVSENWNCPACNSCGLRNEPSLPGADRIRESRS